MPTDEQRLVFSTLRESQNKYVYFLLAGSGAAIGFALNQTQDAALAYSQIPLGLAVILWGASFFCGCRHIQYANSNLYANAELLKVVAGEYPTIGDNREKIQAASDGIRKAMESNSNSANGFGVAQFGFLVAGATSYIAWHVVEMYLRTPGLNS